MGTLFSFSGTKGPKANVKWIKNHGRCAHSKRARSQDLTGTIPLRLEPPYCFRITPCLLPDLAKLFSCPIWNQISTKLHLPLKCRLLVAFGIYSLCSEWSPAYTNSVNSWAIALMEIWAAPFLFHMGRNLQWLGHKVPVSSTQRAPYLQQSALMPITALGFTLLEYPSWQTPVLWTRSRFHSFGV